MLRPWIPSTGVPGSKRPGGFHIFQLVFVRIMRYHHSFKEAAFILTLTKLFTNRISRKLRKFQKLRCKVNIRLKNLDFSLTLGICGSGRLHLLKKNRINLLIQYPLQRAESISCAYGCTTICIKPSSYLNSLKYYVEALRTYLGVTTLT